MDSKIKGVYLWALKWSKGECFTLYETLLYIRANGYSSDELEWLREYMINTEKLELVYNRLLWENT